MKIEFDYILQNNGWAIVELCTRNFKIKFNASYLYDSFYSIIQASIDLLSGKNKVIIPFFSEPKEYQIVIEKVDDKYIELELRLYKKGELLNISSTEDHESLFIGQTSMKSFIVNSFNSAKKILNENDMEEYFQKWGRQFPLNEFNKLESLKKLI